MTAIALLSSAAKTIIIILVKLSIHFSWILWPYLSQSLRLTSMFVCICMGELGINSLSIVYCKILRTQAITQLCSTVNQLYIDIHLRDYQFQAQPKPARYLMNSIVYWIQRITELVTRHEKKMLTCVTKDKSVRILRKSFVLNLDSLATLSALTVNFYLFG